MIPQISTIDLVELASGDRLFLQVYKFIGSQPGKKAYIQANLHGAEIVGNAVIHQTIEFLTTLEPSEIIGEIWLVPVCNPMSTNQRHHFFSTGRFNSYDGKDWNRIFWDYDQENDDLDAFVRSQVNLEEEIIRKNYISKQEAALKKQLEASTSPSSIPYYQRYRYLLQSLCLDANYVIDIHSSSNQGIDYLYCFHTREDSAPYFLLKYGILMTEYDGEAFDEAFMKSWLTLEQKLAQFGRKIRFDVESWTLELGSGMEMKPDSVNIGVLGIKNYLVYKGSIAPCDRYITDIETTVIHLVNKNNIKKYYAPTGGMIQSRVPLGKMVDAGEKLYEIIKFNKTGQLPKLTEICAERKGLVFDVSTNYAVNQGEYVLSILNDE
jgi:uncharacterized protein